MVKDSERGRETNIWSNTQMDFQLPVFFLLHNLCEICTKFLSFFVKFCLVPGKDEVLASKKRIRVKNIEGSKMARRA